MRMNAITSAMNVPLISSSPAWSDVAATSAVIAGSGHSARDDEDEEETKSEVDEVHALDQSDDQEHRDLKASLRLGLTRGAGDRRAAGQTVTDGCADRSSAERESGGDQATHDGECMVHVPCLLTLWCVLRPRGAPLPVLRGPCRSR